MDFIQLNDGNKIPAIGFGVFMIPNDGPTYEAVLAALKAGYRHIDTAAAYLNEGDVGRAVRDSGIPRDQIWVTTKLWPQDYAAADAPAGIELSLKNLGLDYIDLMLLHQPYGPVDEAWAALEDAKAAGKIRSIGVSNMTVSKLEAVFPALRVKPVLIEMELHPAFRQKELRAWCAAHGLQPVGFCPLGSPSRPERDKTSEDIAAMEMPVVREIAARHGIHPAAVCLKWSRQSGAVPIPFSVKPAQYRANLACLTDDPLTDDELAAIDASDADCRLIKGQVFLWEGADDWRALWT